MKINTYGLKMVGLRKAAGATKSLTGAAHSRRYVRISYNLRTGEVRANEYYSSGQNSWRGYNDSDIIDMGSANVPMTMQNIADLIANTIYR